MKPGREQPIEEDFSEISAQPVSLLEGIAILAGAALLIAAGLAGLGVKALGNAFNPERAEAIAQSLLSYEIPGGSRGFFGTNIGGGKMAVVTSVATVPLAQMPPVQPAPEIELFTARMPLNTLTEAEYGSTPSPQPANELFSGFSFSYQDPAAFQVNQAQTEQKPFCGATLPVEVQQGTLTIAGGTVSIPAIKYQVTRALDDQSHIVVISALGDRAAEQASQVFASLKCQ